MVPEATKFPPDEKAFDTYKLPWTWSVAPKFVEVPIPIDPVWPYMANVFVIVPFALDTKSEETLRDPVFNVDTFALVITLIVPETNTLVVKSEFDTHRFPRTFRFAPNKPIEFETKIEDTFEVPKTLRVVPSTFVVTRLFETQTFPDTSSVFPVGLTPIPIFETKLSDETFSVTTFKEFTNRFVVDKALDAQTFPETSSEFPVYPVPILVFDTQTSENVFVVPETFERVAKTFVVVSAFATIRFAPWTELVKRTDAFIDVVFDPDKKRFPKGTETFPIVEEAAPTIFPYKFVVVP